ncbi:hypothetical protein AALH30_22415 [Blautia pseudococcoides]|uniref:hypothetical protein n=1 Tax=Blautia pseudococcoides TaxID=1796616 RepID=UPI00148B06A1|nr:hypothetical protein [Blautia pseudococcoides]MCR2021055.1 hypothetical protein [Blautia pseudococcoides]QJU13655.1 hypothetical protein HL650_03750 [Blautia pseudococcoides]
MTQNIFQSLIDQDDMAAFFNSQYLKRCEDWTENASVLEWCLEESGTDVQHILYTFSGLPDYSRQHVGGWGDLFSAIRK